MLSVCSAMQLDPQPPNICILMYINGVMNMAKLNALMLLFVFYSFILAPFSSSVLDEV